MKRIEIKNTILKYMGVVAKRIFSYIGSGEANTYIIDLLATEAYSELICELDKYGKTAILSVEGNRDGIINDIMQTKAQLSNIHNADIVLTLDPIDGTRAAANGISRAVSAIAVNYSSDTKKIYKPLPDYLSCFCAASNLNENFTQNIYLKNYKKHNSLTVATLMRSESISLWSYLLDKKSIKGEIGEISLYMPSMLFEDVFFAGDTSIPLFLESDSFLGRVGATEALIEAGLWKYWKGFLVSSAKMKKYDGGELKYLHDLIDNISNRTNIIHDFFEHEELEDLYKLGWTDSDILKIHTKESFSPDYDFVLIGSITGTLDKNLKTHSKKNLCPLELKDEKLIMHVYIKENNQEYDFLIKYS